MPVHVVDRVVEPQCDLDLGRPLRQRAELVEQGQAFRQMLLRVIRPVRLGITGQQLGVQRIVRGGTGRLPRGAPAHEIEAHVVGVGTQLLQAPPTACVISHTAEAATKGVFPAASAAEAGACDSGTVGSW